MPLIPMVIDPSFVRRRRTSEGGTQISNTIFVSEGKEHVCR